MGTADRYVTRRFAGIYGVCLVGFILLFLVVDGMGKLDDFLEAAAELPEDQSAWALAVEFYLTRIPAFTVMFAPFLTLFAAIATLMSFTRHNELTPMIISGRSLHRVLAPMYICSIVLTGVLVVAEEAIVPASIRAHESVERQLDPEDLAEGEEVPHLRDGLNVLVAKAWFSSDLRLDEVRSLHFEDPTGELPVGRLDVAELVYRRHLGVVGWYPRGGELVPRDLDAEGRTLPPIQLKTTRPLPFGLRPTEIDVLVEVDKAALQRDELEDLRRLYPQKHELAMQLHTRSARPVSNFVLLLLGLPFVARPGQRSVAAGLTVALGCCAAYMSVDLLFHELGNRGDVHALVAAWFAPVFFGSVGLARLDRVVT